MIGCLPAVFAFPLQHLPTPVFMLHHFSALSIVSNTCNVSKQITLVALKLFSLNFALVSSESFLPFNESLILCLASSV